MGILTSHDFDLTNLQPRPSRADDPVEYDRTPVKLRGEELHKVLWRGRQWAVTEYGIERLDGTYVIAADRLAEKLNDYPWPLHITIKAWADSDDFVTAWLVALAMHGVPAPAAKVRAAVGKSYPRKNRPPEAERVGDWQAEDDE